MLRCVLLATTLAIATLPACAQAVRKFTAQTLRGELIVTHPPEVLLNRQPARLAPGARIRGVDNLLVMSGALVGYSAVVHYTFDTQGNLQDVWVLNAAERNMQPWPVSLQQAASWAFNPDTQSWSRP
jgi:hypothetical protein